MAPGTKIALAGGDEETLLHIAEKLRMHGLPHVLITDSGHLEPPDFDGNPVLTALGAGPLSRRTAARFFGGMPLWTGGGAP